MMRRVALLGITALAMGASRPGGAAARRWVDDEQVLEARQFWLMIGLGAARGTLSGSSSFHALGAGVNFEEAVGLGYGLQAGIRFGSRVHEFLRGLNPDQAARGFDTETFGTGLALVANPELRLRWRAIRWSWGEAGLDERLVLPIITDPNTTEVAGPWMSLHFGHRFRVDGGINAVLIPQSFKRGRELTLAAGFPVQAWVNVTEALFVGLIGSMHAFSATHYTSSYGQTFLGLGIGYRLGACDLTQTTSLLSGMDGRDRRLGVGLGFACHL